MKNSVYVNNTFWFATGGGRSTVLDLLQFSKSLDNGEVLSVESQQIMYKPMETNDGEKTSDGMGWGITEISGHKILYKMGGQPGTSTVILRAPEDHFAVAVACNIGYVENFNEIAFKAAGMILN